MSAAPLPAEVASMVSRRWASRWGLRYVGVVSLMVVLIATTLEVPTMGVSSPLTVHGAILGPASGKISLSLPRGAEPQSAVAPVSDRTALEIDTVPVPPSATAITHSARASPSFGASGPGGESSLHSCERTARDVEVPGQGACSGTPTPGALWNRNISGHLINGVSDFALGRGDSAASSNLTVGTPVPTPSSIDLGQRVNFTSKVSPISSGDKYFWSGLPAGCSTVNKSTVSCKPKVAGKSIINLSVTNSSGTNVTSRNLSFTTRTDPKISSFGASPGSVGIGSTTKVAASVTGGRTPYKYSYSGLPTGCSSRNADTLSCTPSASGTFTVNVIIVDANGFRVNETTPLTVTSPARVLGLPPDQGYAVIIGGVVLLAVLVAIVALVVSRRRKRRKTKPTTPPTQGTAAPDASTSAPRSQQNPPPPDTT